MAWTLIGNIKGATGADGREVELQTGATHIQWRYVGDSTWNDLIAISTLEGEQGEAGEAGSTVVATGYTDSLGKIYRLNSSNSWLLADNSDTLDSLRRLAIGGPDDSLYAAGTKVTLSGLTGGATYYLSITDGTMTTTRPTMTQGGQSIVKLGYAINTTEFFFDPVLETIEWDGINNRPLVFSADLGNVAGTENANDGKVLKKGASSYEVLSNTISEDLRNTTLAFAVDHQPIAPGNAVPASGVSNNIVYWLGTSGALTTTKPVLGVASCTHVIRVGVGIGTDLLWFNPQIEESDYIDVPGAVVGIQGQTGGTNGKILRYSAANTWTDASQADTIDQLTGLVFKQGDEYYPPGSAITGLSSLTAGSVYYLSTSGNITTTPPTPSSTVRRVVIGKAISTTVLLFSPGIPVGGE